MKTRRRREERQVSDFGEKDRYDIDDPVEDLMGFVYERVRIESTSDARRPRSVR